MIKETIRFLEIRKGEGAERGVFIIYAVVRGQHSEGRLQRVFERERGEQSSVLRSPFVRIPRAAPSAGNSPAPHTASAPPNLRSIPPEPAAGTGAAVGGPHPERGQQTKPSAVGAPPRRGWGRGRGRGEQPGASFSYRSASLGWKRFRIYEPRVDKSPLLTRDMDEWQKN